MTTRHAACSCGQLRVTTDGDPTRISVCHCHACQRRTGGAFGVQARFPVDRAEIEGQAVTWTRTADSGNDIDFYFCPECGSTVYYVLRDQPELVAVPIGAFADSSFPAPRISVYESRRHPWRGLPDDFERHD